MKSLFRFGRPAKKAQLGGLQALVIGLVVIGFVLAIGLTLVGKVRDTTTAGTAERNATVEVLAAIAEIPGWMSIIVLAFIAVIVLGVVYLLQRRT